jgi:predicted RNase H-like nuclease
MMGSVSAPSVLGVDGCPGGWIGALVTGRRVRWLALPDATAVLAVDAAAAGIDIPIGLPDCGGRTCDLLARQRLAAARSSVFPAPVRAVLDAASYRDACERQRAATGAMISQQLWRILPKIREVDLAVTAADQRRVLEVHPEVSFRAMDSRVFDRKKSPRGVGQRLRALAGWVDLGALADVPPGVRLDDALDALAVAWTARRWLAGRAETLPAGAPELDGRGLRMGIVV